jgi:hypothetical protein
MVSMIDCCLAGNNEAFHAFSGCNYGQAYSEQVTLYASLASTQLQPARSEPSQAYRQFPQEHGHYMFQKHPDASQCDGHTTASCVDV